MHAAFIYAGAFDRWNLFAIPMRLAGAARRLARVETECDANGMARLRYALS